MQNNEMASPMVQPLLDAYSIYKNDYTVGVLALFLSPRTVPNMSVYGPDHRFQVQGLDFKRSHLVCLHPVVNVSSSVWWLSMEIGILYLFQCYVGPR